MRFDHGLDACCHVLSVFLAKEFDGKLSCTVDDIIQRAKVAEDFPIPIQADRLCDLAEALSTRTKILFLRNKESLEKSYIVLDIDTLLKKIHGRIFAPQTLPEHCLTPTHTGVLPWSQIERHLPDLNPSLVVSFLGRLEFCQVVKDPEVLSLIVGRSDTSSLDSDEETDFNTSGQRPSLVSQASCSSAQTCSSGCSSASNHTTGSSVASERDGLEPNWLGSLYSTSTSPQHPGSTKSTGKFNQPTGTVSNQQVQAPPIARPTPPCSIPPATELPQSQVHPSPQLSSSLSHTGVPHHTANSQEQHQQQSQRQCQNHEPHLYHKQHQNGIPGIPSLHNHTLSSSPDPARHMNASSPTIVTRQPPPTLQPSLPFSPPVGTKEGLLSPPDVNPALCHALENVVLSNPLRMRQASSPPRYSTHTSKVHDQLHRLGRSAGGSHPSLPEEQTWPPGRQLGSLHRSPSDSCTLSSSNHHHHHHHCAGKPQARSQGGSPRMSRHIHASCAQSPVQPNDTFLFFPGLVNSGQPSGEMWLPDSSFVFYSGWCLQSAQPHKFFTPRFLQTLILRLAFGFAVSRPPNGGLTSSMSLFSRECTIWKNGLRWLNLDGVESFVEMVEDGRALLLLMRAKKGSELKGVSLRSALIQKILATKEECCPSMPIAEYLIHPKHLKERGSYPIITQRLNQLTRYDVNLVARAIVAENRRTPGEHVES